jgi:hypothetical protein
MSKCQICEKEKPTHFSMHLGMRVCFFCANIWPIWGPSQKSGPHHNGPRDRWVTKWGQIASSLRPRSPRR